MVGIHIRTVFIDRRCNYQRVVMHEAIDRTTVQPNKMMILRV